MLAIALPAPTLGLPPLKAPAAGGLPFGDQALFCRRRDYAEAGGFPHEPLLEDVAFVLRRRRLGPLAVAPGCLARLYNGARPR